MTQENPKQKTSVLRALLPARLTQWVGVAITFALVAGVGGFAVAASGAFNLSAVPPHPAGWAQMLHYGMDRSVAHHAGNAKPNIPLDRPSLIMQGAVQYDLICSNCHGAPGMGQNPVALSMRPEPPVITEAVKGFSDAELFFIISNGVRYTGMPAWPVTNRPDEVWAIVAFLKAMPGMDRTQYMKLVNGDIPVSGSTVFSGDAGVAANIAEFVPSKVDRPIFPGDPQSAFASAASTVSPRTGFEKATCETCHGADGSGRAGGAFPNLTLQSPQYLYDALKAFASGQRQSGIMWVIASNLSDDQMRATASRIGLAPATASHQEKLAAIDITKTKAGRCGSCHLSDGLASNVIPAIDGQYESYLETQMTVFRDGGRGNTSNYDPMNADAHALSDEDIKTVAAYYGARAPVQKRSAAVNF